MIDVVTGITKIDHLYLDLLYACNFECHHCFHGEHLKSNEQITLSQARKLITFFRVKYGSTCLVLLGGEPFLYDNLFELVHYAKEIGYRVEICTNGYKITNKLLSINGNIDLLRVSIDGLEEVHDYIRKRGSYKEVIKTLKFANSAGIKTSITLTVTKPNLTQIIPLAYKLNKFGIDHIKLHCLRDIGCILKHPELIIYTTNDYILLGKMLEKHIKRINVPFIVDEDLCENFQLQFFLKNRIVVEEASRVEIQPDGAVYISCKAVGNQHNAFSFNKETCEIQYFPKKNDEIQQRIKQIRYLHLRSS